MCVGVGYWEIIGGSSRDHESRPVPGLGGRTTKRQEMYGPPARYYLARCHAEIGGKPLAHELRRKLLQGKYLLEHDQNGSRDVPAGGFDVTVCRQRRTCADRRADQRERMGGRS